jgi:YD repeat-containing protein
MSKDNYHKRPSYGGVPVKMPAFLLACALLIVQEALPQVLPVIGDSYRGKYKETKVGLDCDRDFGGEQLFTGDVAFSVPITEIGGVPIALTYSSNVHHLVSAPAARSQSGWVGLGWTLGVGSIVGETNGTVDPSDDRYFYQGPEVSTELVCQNGNEFVLKDYKFWKITRVLDTSEQPNRIKGWTIVREDGTTYHYGNYAENGFILDYEPTRATRFQLSWGNLICNPPPSAYGAAHLAPCRWDLSDIQDIHNNHTSVKYQQLTGSMWGEYPSGNPVSTIPYTRESYLMEVSDRSGSKVSFEIQQTAETEYEFYSGSNIQKQYETRQLGNIKTYNMKGQLTAQFELGYDMAGVYDASTRKRYLTSITRKDPSGTAIPDRRFEYYGVGTIADGPNHGALKRVVMPTGGDVVYTYAATQLATVGNVGLETEVRLDADLTYNPGTSSFYAYVKSCNSLGVSGKDFIVLRQGLPTLSSFLVYRYGPKGWQLDPIPSQNYYNLNKVWVRNDYMAVMDLGRTRITVHKRIGAGWSTGGFTSPSSTFTVLGMGNDFFVVSYGPENENARIAVIQWTTSGWQWNYVGQYQIQFTYPDDRMKMFWADPDAPILAACGNRFFVINSVYKCWNWNGQVWEEKEISKTGLLYNTDFQPYAGDDYFVLQHFSGNGKTNSSVFYWDGSEWRLSFYTDILTNGTQTFGDYFVTYPLNSQNDPRLYTKSIAGGWQPIGIPLTARYALRDDFLATGYDQNRLSMCRRYPNPPGQATWYSNLSNNIFDYGTGFVEANPIVNGNSLLGFFTNGVNNAVYSIGLYSYHWKSGVWVRNSLLVDPPGGPFTGGCVQPGAAFVAILYGRDNENVHCRAFRRGTGTDFSDVFSGHALDFPVTVKTLHDQMGHADVTSYEYANGVYDEDMRSAKYNKVSVTLPQSSGKQISYFYNNLPKADLLELKDTDQDDPSGEVAGLAYRTQSLNSTGTTVVSESYNNWYEIYYLPRPAGNSIVYRPSQIDSTNSGITTSYYFTYGSVNGEVEEEKREVEVDDGVDYPENFVRRITYAHHDAMLSAHILNEVYEESIESLNESNNGLPLTSRRTLYQDILPLSQQIWTGGETWKTIQTVLSRDAVGNVLETVDANGTVSTDVYGYNSSLKVGTFVNAHKENTLISCFDDEEESTWSGSGTWAIEGGIYRQTDDAPTQQGGGYLRVSNAASVDDATLECDVRLDNVGSEGYVAITKFIDSGNFVQFELHASETIVRVLASRNTVHASADASLELFGGRWYHLRGEIRGEEARLFVDGELVVSLEHVNVDHASGQLGLCTFRASASFDNVRLYPVNALAASISYDPQFYRENVFSDPNGRALTKTYDSFGRIVILEDFHSGSDLADFTYYYSRSTNPEFDPQNPNSILSRTYLTPGLTVSTISYYDGLNRAMQSQSLAPEGKIITAWEFDAFGRAIKTYKSFKSSGSAFYFDPEYEVHCGLYYGTGSYPFAETEYLQDPLNRIGLTSFPGNEFKKGFRNVTFEYGTDVSNQWLWARRTDENGNQMTTWQDRAHNNVRTQTNSLLTLSCFDVLGRVTETTPPKGQAYKTSYGYNNQGLLSSRHSPDAGTTQYRYDANGNIRFVADAVRSAASRFVYRKYDIFGRLTEEGEYTGTVSFLDANVDDREFPNSSKIPSQVLVYDEVVAAGQRNMKGRVSRIEAYRSGSSLLTSTYSYDGQGRTEWIQHEGLGTAKRLEYAYDLQGNIVKKSYLDLGSTNNDLYTYYEYDNLGRICRVYTSIVDDETGKTVAAEYTYNASDEVQQAVLGDLHAQTVDYSYNERDWLTGINNVANPGSDKFAERIQYYTSASGLSLTPQYNGNISAVEYFNRGLGDEESGGRTAYGFSYDPANRLTGAQHYSYSNYTYFNENAYSVPTITYDNNGNILHLTRKGYDGLTKDDFSYSYPTSSNRLTSISYGSTTKTYEYDANGNVVSDEFRQITGASYNLQNLPIAMTKTGADAISYSYDGAGNRIRKQQGSLDERYVLGAEGQTEAVYGASGLLFWNIIVNGKIIGKLVP